jgi:hypothetical protein
LWPDIAPVQLFWDPFDQNDPGPCMKVIVSNSDETIEAGRAIGLEYPKACEITALLDTGSPFTFINRVYAKNQKLFLTNPRTEIRTIGGQYPCGEHSGAISFPNTGLRRIETLRILSGNFEKERHFSCLIGRDVMRFWNVTFDGRSKRVTIIDQSESTFV